MSIQKFVLDTVAGSAADLTRPGGGKVLLTGDTQGFLRPLAQSIDLKYFNPEALENLRVVGTPAANTDYEFSIEQEIDGEISKVFVAVSTTTAPTDAELGAAITANVQAYIDAGQLKATVTAYASTTGGVDILALTGYATLRVIQLNNVTQTSLLASGTSTGNLSASGTTLTMLQSTTAAFSVGGLVKLSGWTGTAVINGNTAAEGTILRVSSITTNTNVVFIADSITGSISAAATDYQLVASNVRVSGANLIAQGVSTATSANTYHEVVVQCKLPSGDNLTVTGYEEYVKHYYINAGDADALALMTGFSYVKQYLNAAGSAADPLLL